MDAQPERFRDEGRRVEVYWDGEGAFFRYCVLLQRRCVPVSFSSCLAQALDQCIKY